jgi:hypothetical protein
MIAITHAAGVHLMCFWLQHKAQHLTCSPTLLFSMCVALTNWSAPKGMHSSGLPAARPSLVLQARG